MATSASAALIAAGATAEKAAAQNLANPATGGYNWSGFYGGITAGGVYSDTDDGFDGGRCGPFTNLVGEGGGDVDFEEVDDIPESPFAPAGCWNGYPYAGPNTAIELPSFDLDDDYVAYSGVGRKRDKWSGSAGAYVGYNIQVGRFVYGFEADATGSFGGDSSNRVTFDYFDDGVPRFVTPPDFLPGPGPQDGLDSPSADGLPLGPYIGGYFGQGDIRRETEIDWMTSLRARLGATLGAGGRVLLYGTGGVAIASISDRIEASFDDGGADEICDDCSFSGESDDDDDIKFGVTFGAGAEFGLTNNLRLGVEYLYTHFEDDGDNRVTFTGNGGRAFDVTLPGGIDDTQTVRARLTYAFGVP